MDAEADFFQKEREYVRQQILVICVEAMEVQTGASSPAFFPTEQLRVLETDRPIGVEQRRMNNESLIDDEDVELYELSILEMIFWCILYVMIALLAIVGNSLVIYVTLVRLRSRAVTAHFIINLAFADLLTGVFAIPFKFQAALFQEWFLPRSLCQIVPYTETVSLSVSVFTLTASAIHEFRTVFCPKSGRLSNRSVKSIVVMIWVIAAVVSLPHGLFHKVYEILDDSIVIAQCRPVYADDSWWKIYNVYLTIIHYFVPMIILDTAYTMIAIKLWGTTVSGGEEAQNLNIGSLNSEISNRKLMNMLMIVVACFSLCWFPLETYLLLNEIRPEINRWKYINVLFFCSHWLAMSNSFLNPIIYGLYNNKYKREYRRVLRILLCKAVPETTEEVLKFDTEFSAGDFRSFNRFEELHACLANRHSAPKSSTKSSMPPPRKNMSLHGHHFS